MTILKMFDKLDDIIYKPIELITDWAKEPLRRWEYGRREEDADNRLKREIERETAVNKIESEINRAEKEHEVNLSIKKETEVRRIIAEIEEWRSDQDFNRMQAVSEAIMKYQHELTKLNVNAMNAVGNMQLELRNKAQDMVYEKTVKYKELQDQAMNDAVADLKRIETEFPENETARNILTKAVDKRLANIIDTANNFILELNNDIKAINSNISLLANSGQKFIEEHLKQFQAVGFIDDNIKQLR